MNTSKLWPAVGVVRQTGPEADVSGVEYDSRRVRPGSLFVAMQGGTTDGNRFLASAAALGAAAIVTDSQGAFDEAAREYPGIAVGEVRHGRHALANIAAQFFDHPERKLALSGVTGTNGKTTTAFLLDAMLNHVSRKTILVGTIEYHLAGQVYSSPHTTPESRDLLELFREGVELGATEAVMEVSSHALEQGRVWGLHYDVAIYTNLTQDHLDFHGSMDNYFATKRRLFEGTGAAPPRTAVINTDDAYGLQIADSARRAGSQVITYGMTGGQDFLAGDLRIRPSGIHFTMSTPGGDRKVETSLAGKVNAYNLLAASAAAVMRGLSLDDVVTAAAELQSVPGRFQNVDAGQPFPVIVDYAHTGDALHNLLLLAREMVRERDGRVITLFGCGGDRDRSKRPQMGRIAGESSDFVVLTSDNPRSENPETILGEIVPGLEPTGTKFVVEPDRLAAIRLAIQKAAPGDIVLLAGKGHEKIQVLQDRTIHFDDAAAARTILAAEGYEMERHK